MENSKLIIAAIAGAAAGAIAALLFAPETGEELRTQIKDGARKLTDDLKSSLQNGLNTVTKAKTQVEDLVNESTNAYSKPRNVV